MYNNTLHLSNTFTETQHYKNVLLLAVVEDMEDWLDSEDEDYNGEEGDLEEEDWMDALDQARAGLDLEAEDDYSSEETTTIKNPPSPSLNSRSSSMGPTEVSTHTPPNGSASSFNPAGPSTFSSSAFTPITYQETPCPTRPLGSDASLLDAFLQVFGEDTCDQVAETPSQ
jgi:hypothetical protein